jgi:hypothetical protein
LVSVADMRAPSKIVLASGCCALAPSVAMKNKAITRDGIDMVLVW